MLTMIPRVKRQHPKFPRAQLPHGFRKTRKRCTRRATTMMTNQHGPPFLFARLCVRLSG